MNILTVYGVLEGAQTQVNKHHRFSLIKSRINRKPNCSNNIQYLDKLSCKTDRNGKSALRSQI